MSRERNKGYSKDVCPDMSSCSEEWSPLEVQSLVHVYTILDQQSDDLKRFIFICQLCHFENCMHLIRYNSGQSCVGVYNVNGSTDLLILPI